MEVLFGPWDRFSSLTLDSITIEPLASGPDVFSSLKADGRSSRGWLYPPLGPAPLDCRRDAPLVPVTAFSLAPTHRLSLLPPKDDDQLADFLIAMMGLLDGVRLTREGWSHFYKAPLERHKLSDLVVGDRELMEVLRIATNFWLDAPSEVRVRIFGAVHWTLFSGLYEHDFERFGAMYCALDALYAVHVELGRPTSRGHSGRASVLATHYAMPVPAWAIMVNGDCVLSELRNELVHEARYAGAPTGFAHPTANPDITLELAAFVSRLTLAVLGVPCGYTTSAVTTRQMHGLDLTGPLTAV